jgi:hypothetical protein
MKNGKEAIISVVMPVCQLRGIHMYSTTIPTTVATARRENGHRQDTQTGTEI